MANAQMAFNPDLAPEENAARPGRPRSDKSRKAILNATRRMLTHMPLSELTIEAIAKKAGVGKTTIYRWWPSKAAIAMEAFLEQPGVQNIIPTTTSASQSVTKQLENLIRQLRGQNGRIIAGVIAESQSSDEVLDLLYVSFLQDRVEPLMEAITRGVKTGEFRKNLDATLALDMMLGAIFMRVLSGEHGMDDHFADNFPKQTILSLKA